MLWSLGGSLLGIFTGITIWKSMSKEYLDPAYGELTEFSIVPFGGVIGFMFGVFIGMFMNPSETKTVVYEYQLGSLRNSGITGTFFLGTGGIEDGAYYRYYLKDTSGGYQLKTLRAEDEKVIVLEEDRSDAILKIFIHQIYHPKKENSLWTLRVADTNTPLRWEFHVPRGSIQPVFSLR